jgi:hypothetical protein
MICEMAIKHVYDNWISYNEAIRTMIIIKHVYDTRISYNKLIRFIIHYTFIINIEKYKRFLQLTNCIIA